MAAVVATSQSKGLDLMGAHQTPGRPVAAAPAHPSPVARPALCRHSPEVGARCVNRARRDLCGGCSVMSIPTATIDPKPTMASVSFLKYLRHDWLGDMNNYVNGVNFRRQASPTPNRPTL